VDSDSPVLMRVLSSLLDEVVDVASSAPEPMVADAPSVAETPT
jgi:hypothetical protein